MALRRQMTPDEIHSFRKRVVQDCTADIARCTIPFFGIQDGEAKQNGTGTLLQIADRYFVLTAAHVLDFPMDYGFPYYFPSGIDGGKFIPLNRLLAYTNPFPERYKASDHNKRDHDHIDVGVCELTPEIAKKLLPVRRFARLLEIDRSRGFPQAFYMLIGYPNALTRPLDKEGKKIFSEPLRCVTDLYQGEARDGNTDEHLFLGFPEEGVDNDDKPYIPPDPKGMSGGGIWRLIDPDKAADQWKPEDVKLVAIEHSWLESRRYIRGTTIAIALALIYHHNESLRPILDMQYGKP